MGCCEAHCQERGLACVWRVATRFFRAQFWTHNALILFPRCPSAIANAHEATRAAPAFITSLSPSPWQRPCAGHTLLLPIYHRGMARLFPQNAATNKLLHTLPRRGQHIRLIVGEPIDISALCAKHRQRRVTARGLCAVGPGGSSETRRYVGDAEAEAAASDDLLREWEDTDADLALYSDIMREIERALAALEARMDVGDAAAAAASMGDTGLA